MDQLTYDLRHLKTGFSNYQHRKMMRVRDDKIVFSSFTQLITPANSFKITSSDFPFSTGTRRKGKRRTAQQKVYNCKLWKLLYQKSCFHQKLKPDKLIINIVLTITVLQDSAIIVFYTRVELEFVVTDSNIQETTLHASFLSELIIHEKNIMFSHTQLCA